MTKPKALYVELPDELHSAFKAHAASMGLSIKDFVVYMLTALLEANEKRETTAEPVPAPAAFGTRAARDWSPTRVENFTGADV